MHFHNSPYKTITTCSTSNFLNLQLHGWRARLTPSSNSPFLNASRSKTNRIPLTTTVKSRSEGKTIQLKGMKRKKMHEVQQICPYINAVWKESGIHTIVDIGAGQGYISCVFVPCTFHRIVFGCPVWIRCDWGGNAKGAGGEGERKEQKANQLQNDHLQHHQGNAVAGARIAPLPLR